MKKLSAVMTAAMLTAGAFATNNVLNGVSTERTCASSAAATVDEDFESVFVVAVPLEVASFDSIVWAWDTGLGFSKFLSTPPSGFTLSIR